MRRVGRDQEKQRAHRAAYAKRMRERREVDPEYVEYLRQRRREWEARTGYRKQGKSRDKHIAYKRDERRKLAEAQGRVLLPPVGQRGRHDAHVKAWFKVARVKYDAHVRSWKADKTRIAKWKYDHNPKYMIYHRLKRWMHKHLGNALPSRKWSQHLGYTVDELRTHIERQFVKGMGWHNKGEWHIDHIVPVSAFDVDGVEHPDFNVCFGLPNLRPMWANDNLRKNGKRLTLL